MNKKYVIKSSKCKMLFSTYDCLELVLSKKSKSYIWFLSRMNPWSIFKLRLRASRCRSVNLSIGRSAELSFVRSAVRSVFQNFQMKLPNEISKRNFRIRFSNGTFKRNIWLKFLNEISKRNLKQNFPTKFSNKYFYTNICKLNFQTKSRWKFYLEILLGYFICISFIISKK